ncbi:MAG: DNA helicase UvrD [Candidatus Aenigmatarchaeota archaeon]|nr:MAG: DNA helicase UvrD [Candidatus Aenigmarchaeota archaeon]
MRIFADLHIHGPYSMATSRAITIENLEKYGRMKGLNLLGTGDFTHPTWFHTLKNSLKEDGTGILKTDSGFSFMLSTEVSNVYEQDGSTRKVHNVLHVPDFDTAAQVNDFLSKRGNLIIDGRPTFNGMTCPELVEGIMSISKDIMIIPAHAWTPWFGVFGSKSGFDSVKECFKDQTKHIFALETGMSSDPEMNWRLSSLDRYALVSNSDAHSCWPWRIGREANVFELNEMTYNGIMSAIRKKDNRHFLFTIEVDPGYGKYHYDGHRECNVCLDPRESAKAGNICPVCRKPLTIGVLNRVEGLADRPEGHLPRDAVPFKRLLPLSEIIAAVLGTDQLYSKKIWAQYEKLLERFGSELHVLLSAGESEMRSVSNEKIAKLVIDSRQGRTKVLPGYDGVYGRLSLEEKHPEKNRNPQSSLSSFFG